MFSFVNRMKACPFKKALVIALACTVLSGMLAPATVAAREAKRPHVIPGDADGPAGVQDAVVVRDRADTNVLPLCLSLGPWTGGFISLWIGSSGEVTWIGLLSTRAHAVEHPKR